MIYSLQIQLADEIPSTIAENAATFWKFGEDEWRGLYSDWEECGYKTYFKFETYTTELIGARIPVLHITDLKETTETVHSIYYSIELNDEKRNKFLQEYRNFADRLKELSLEDK